jgi:hypothetical protein
VVLNRTGESRLPEVLDPLRGQRGVPARVGVRAEPEVVGDAESAVGGRALCDVADPGELSRAVRRRPAQDLYASRGRGEHADHKAEQRGLAGAVRANQTDDAPGRDSERAVRQRPVAPVPLCQDRVWLRRGCSYRLLLVDLGPDGPLDDGFDALSVQAGCPSLTQPGQQVLAQLLMGGCRVGAQVFCCVRHRLVTMTWPSRYARAALLSAEPDGSAW